MSRLLPLAAGAAAALLLLAGCAAPIDTSNAERVDGAVTVPASDLALAAEGVVLEQGFTVEIDCGSADVPLEVGASVECSAFDPATESTGGYVVTITAVDGTDYEIEVVGSEATPQPAPESALESAQAFADLTAQAITDSLGEAPFVDCGTDDIEIFEGQDVRCAYETSSASGFVVATVTSFDGSFYEISVVEE
ncbi:hypothetical protein [Microcella humidisoli]|uniref:DUF4333 domain-containing protein n=1 Tax=Microcella humidisoli TaxID=2963406 RepID=A0ABY5FV42_9MICO|nr:hypothetical protein [Microcella humidisoli]UTT61938.1 hypothetical protein NNL39_09690 [Microcella humidisoli]